MASDGTIGQAVDHMLATRSLHGTVGRFGLKHPSLDEFKHTLTDLWELYELDGSPTRTLQVVAQAHERIDDDG